MLNLTEHETAGEKTKISLSCFKTLRLCIYPVNVKMPTIVGILTFMSRMNFKLCLVEHEKSLITSGQGLLLHVSCLLAEDLHK